MIPAPANILVVHTGAIGDVVCSIPGVRSIVSKYILDFCCQKHIFPIIKKIPNIRNIYDINCSMISSVFLSTVNINVKKWLSKYQFIILFSFSKDWEKQFKLYNLKVYRLSPRPPKNLSLHVADFIINALKEKKLIINNPIINELILHKKNKCYNNNSFKQLKSTIIIHPGSGSSFKNWPFDCFISLAKRLRQNKKLVKWMIGPAEKDYEDLLIKGEELEKNVLNVDKLEDVFNALENAKYFVGNDSGISHVAALTGLKTIVIFGPSDYRRWAPVGTKVKIISEQITCQPCFETGARDCKHRKCLTEISVKKVLDSILERQDMTNE